MNKNFIFLSVDEVILIHKDQTALMERKAGPEQ
jgi:hypothetical protein